MVFATLPGGGFFILTVSNRAFIFTNGEITSPHMLYPMITPGDWLIAADGGARHLEGLGLRPQVVIGDLDSIDPALLERYRGEGVEIYPFPVDKDETDLELALIHARRMGCIHLWIAGALGGRLDQTLANISLLGHPILDNCETRLEDGMEEVFLIRGQAEIHGTAGDVVSLLPLGKPAVNVSTTGLKYPLNGEVLYPEHSRGVSNVMDGSLAQVRLGSGVLVCVHTRRQG